MEQVLYNTIAGAKPILADGTSFYYSDYNRDDAKKVYYEQKWPCCSGTFPQLSADYGISSYYAAKEGIYVNLFIPSRVSWMQGGTPCTLTQKTSYPASNETELQLEMSRPEKFTIYVRVPAWSDANTRIHINGKRAEGEVVAGQFFELTRTWKNGDRVEYEIGMPLRLDAIDAQNPQIVALRQGPLALFGVGDLPASFTRAQLLAASAYSQDWMVQGSAGKATFRSFAAIGDEPYRLYHTVDS
jgi:hypothetical protein